MGSGILAYTTRPAFVTPQNVAVVVRIVDISSIRISHKKSARYACQLVAGHVDTVFSAHFAEQLLVKIAFLKQSTILYASI